MRATEKIQKGDLHGNATFYLDNPLEVDCLPHYVGASPEIAADAEVCILYFSESHRQSYFRRKPQNCGHCHDCGIGLRNVLDGEEWCARCAQYRRYRSHGWVDGEISPCPQSQN